MVRKPGWVGKLRDWARRLKRDTVALWLAAHDPRVPLAAKLFCAVVAAYALSPIDLIPDAIPVLGLLDEAILLPLCIALAVRMIPAPLMAALRAEAEARLMQPISRAGAAGVIALWLAAAGAVVWWLLSPAPASLPITRQP